MHVLTNMACWLNHHLVWYYLLKPIFTPSFLSAKRDFFKETVYATTFVTNMAAKRWKIAANPHYQTPAFCLLQVSPSSNSVKFSVLLQCLDIFTQLAADRILNKKKQIPMKLPIFPNRAANGWTLGCFFCCLMFCKFLETPHFVTKIFLQTDCKRYPYEVGSRRVLGMIC